MQTQRKSLHIMLLSHILLGPLALHCPSALAQTNNPAQDAFPPGYKGSVKFDGRYQGRVVTAAGPPTTKRYAWGPPVTIANPAKVTEESNTYWMILQIDGDKVLLSTSLSFAMIPSSVSGTRVGDRCTFPGPRGNLVAHCGPNSFIGEYTSSDGASPAVSFRMEAGPVGQTPRGVSLQTTSATFSNLPYKGSLACGSDIVPMDISLNRNRGIIHYYLPYGKKYAQGGRQGYSFDIQFGRDGRIHGTVNDNSGLSHLFMGDIDLIVEPNGGGVHGIIHSNICQEFSAAENDGSAYRFITANILQSFTKVVMDSMNKESTRRAWTESHCHLGQPGQGYICDH